MKVTTKPMQDGKKLAFSVQDVAEATSLSKSFIRNEIRDKNLKAKRCNRRLLIMPDDLQDYLSKLEGT
jgi:excisionase family DNA binding protein